MIIAGPSRPLKGIPARSDPYISRRNVMKAAGLVLICGMLYVVNTGAQTQEGAQAGVAAGGQASGQASQHGAQASAKGNNSAKGSAQGTQSSAMLGDGTAFNGTPGKPIDSRKRKAGEAVTGHAHDA